MPQQVDRWQTAGQNSTIDSGHCQSPWTVCNELEGGAILGLSLQKREGSSSIFSLRMVHRTAESTCAERDGDGRAVLTLLAPPLLGLPLRRYGAHRQRQGLPFPGMGPLRAARSLTAPFPSYCDTGQAGAGQGQAS